MPGKHQKHVFAKNNLQWFVWSLFGAACLAALTLLLLRVSREAIDYSQYVDGLPRADWISARRAALESGEEQELYFYSTYDTDELLEEFEGMPEILKLSFELTDLSSDGMKIVATFPNLRELMLYGGRPVVDDVGLQHLSGHKRLENLKLINTDVTDDGLEVLQTLPKLQALTLFREGTRPVKLTDQGLLSLHKLEGLQELEVSGGWASDSAIRELRDMMPNCKVSTESQW